MGPSTWTSSGRSSLSRRGSSTPTARRRRQSSTAPGPASSRCSAREFCPSSLSSSRPVSSHVVLRRRSRLSVVPAFLLLCRWKFQNKILEKDIHQAYFDILCLQNVKQAL